MSRPRENGLSGTKKSLLPCTPLAIIKLMEYLKVYDEALPMGDRMQGKSVVVINRSEIVGRPLAAMLANDGADVYSVVKAEFVAMRLAQRVGLDVATVEWTQVLGRDVLLVERFDRVQSGSHWSRRAMVSALTMMGLDEMMVAHASYAQLAEIVRLRFDAPLDSLRELFARMVFNVLCGMHVRLDGRGALSACTCRRSRSLFSPHFLSLCS